MGRADRPKGILKTAGSSGKIIPFVQDPNYYFQKGSYYHKKNKLPKALLFLKKAIELEPDNAQHHYNLACLLSQTSQLQEANRIFKHIVSNLAPEMTECYFLMAINYGLMDDLAKTRQYLHKYLQHTDISEITEEARELLLAMEEDSIEDEFTAQDKEALEKAMASLSDGQLQERFIDSSFQRVLQWGLYEGSDVLKERILKLYGTVRDQKAISALKEFVVSPWVKERLRQVALLELKKIDPAGSCRIYTGGCIKEINLAHATLPAPVWCQKWQEVLDCACENMRKSPCYGEEFFEDIRAIWLDYINHVYPQMPRIGKIQAWAAGLEYCLARFHFLGLTQKELAQSYRVSPASVSRTYKLINRMLHIDQKAYRNMLSFLVQHDLDRN
ncbi:MAG TPA: tetratricopeptide repeat protein [Bacillota bacterium]|nr:tetratricopeptide repeat protein [Bacillota bacterium]